MPTPCWLKHLCSIRALVPMSVFLSFFLSLFFRLIPWSTEALWVHFPARASKTFLRRRSAPSPHQEGAWGLREQSKSCARGFIGFLHKPRNISLFLSFNFLLSTRDHQVPVHLRTSTLFQSCGHCWVFQICWHIECSTFSGFEIAQLEFHHLH